MELNDNIQSIKGIGEKTALLFAKASVFSVKQLLDYYPSNYRSYPKISAINELKEGTFGAVKARICSVPMMFSSGSKKVLNFSISDGTGIILVYFFNMPYLKNKYKKGYEVLFTGHVSRDKKGNLCFSNPKETTESEYACLVKGLWPIYPLVKDLSNNTISKALKQCVSCAEQIEEYLPENILSEYNMMTLSEATRKIHFPENMDEVYSARNRMALHEFLCFIHKMEQLKNNDINVAAPVFERSDSVNSLMDKLPFKLTKGQKEAFDDISSDLESGIQMNRLIQGDVGCGKTIVAILSAYQVILHGAQAALMAPTVVLAAQHYNDIKELSDKLNLSIKPVLLTGSLKASERKKALKGIENGEFNFIIGTHALITDKVEYNKLAFVVCDEQHRFGVKQRTALLSKGQGIHLLVMSATPIPRTLGIILYGDLSISVIKEKPSCRLPLKNALVGPEYRQKNYEFIRKHVEAGEQAYIIVPMVDESSSEGMENLKNAEDYPDEIRPFFPDNIRIASLHGKMKSDKKDAVMTAFKNHETDILISTTVIEVGVNVPNATVMMIENSERFGLATLHQLRGRVGRGSAQSYVIFVTDSKSEKNTKRLKILTETNDGFEIADEDLKQRGPGDFFGYRQSGTPAFKIADILTDADILRSARVIYDRLLKDGFDFDDKLKELALIDNNMICL